MYLLTLIFPFDPEAQEAHVQQFWYPESSQKKHITIKLLLLMPLLDHLWHLLHPVVLLDQDVPKTKALFESYSIIIVPLYRMHGLLFNISSGTYRKSCGTRGTSKSINTCLALNKNQQFNEQQLKNKLKPLL